MHIRRIFQLFSRWSWQNLTLLSTLSSWKHLSSSLLWFPWHHPLLLASYFPGRIIFFCLLPSVTLISWSLKYSWGFILRSLFFLQLVVLHGHASPFELWCPHWWFPVAGFSSTQFLLSARLSSSLSVRSFHHNILQPPRTLGSPKWAHPFLAFLLEPLPTLSIWVCDIVIQYSEPRGWMVLALY